jgi:nucleotide-binding universal stress UspA family protein
MTLPRTIVVPTDFSEYADHALDYAVELAVRFDATVHLIHAISFPTTGVHEIAYSAMAIASLTKAAQVALDARKARYRERIEMASARCEIGDVRDVIDRAAATLGADLIVMGTHGRRGIRRLLIGSVAESVVRSAPCPVLTVRPCPAKH